MDGMFHVSPVPSLIFNLRSCISIILSILSTSVVYPPRDILRCSMVTMLDLRLPPASISAAPAAGQLLLHSCSCLRRVTQLPGNCAAAGGGAKLSRVSAASRSMLTADLGIISTCYFSLWCPLSSVS